MDIVLLVVGVLVLAFGGVVLVGAPYLPTLRPQAAAAFELLQLKEGQTLLELGCGDGKVLLLAAERGYQVVGIELNPFLALFAWPRTRHRRADTDYLGGFWRTPWPEADGVFVFLLDRFMPKLDARMEQYGGPLASVAFKIPGKTAVQERDGVFLYRYARVRR